MHDVASSPSHTSTLTAVDLFIAFTIFENIMMRSRKIPSSERQGIPVNYRDYRVLFPSPTSRLWIEFAKRLITRIETDAIGSLGKDDLKAVVVMLKEFEVSHPSLAWTTLLVEFRKACWIDQETDRFFPKNDYVINGKGKTKVLELRTLFPNLLAKMHTVGEEIHGFVEYVIP